MNMTNVRVGTWRLVGVASARTSRRDVRSVSVRRCRHFACLFGGLVFVVQMILYLNTVHVETDVQAGSRRLRRGVKRSRRRLRGPADTCTPSE